MPQVSVVIPVHNPGHFLAIAVESVIQQTFQDWELIIVDDGSEERIGWAETGHPRIRIVSQANQGQSVARNVGIAQSTGEFVAFLDQDDVWMPAKLEQQLVAMEREPQAVLCHTQFRFIDAAGQPAGPGFARYQTYLDMLTGSGVAGSSTIMARKKHLLAAGLFDPFSQPAEDYDLCLRLLHQGSMAFVETCLAQYRQHGGNQTRHYHRVFSANTSIIRKHRLAAKLRGDREAMAAAGTGLRRVRRTFGAQAFDQCRASLHQRRLTELGAHLRWAVLLAPGYVATETIRYALRQSAVGFWNSATGAAGRQGRG